MKKNEKLSKVALFCMLISSIIFWGSCKKNDNPGLNQANVPGITSQSLASATVYTLNLTGLRSDGGYCYKLAYALPQYGDSNSAPDVSTLQLYENGKALGPAHSVHQDIRDYGKGAYSHWLNELYFSASDNTNPATNGRKYTYTMTPASTTSTTKTTTTPTTTTPAPTTTTTGGSASASTTGVSSALMGYAMVDGTTTGGAGGQTVTVTTLSALKSAVANPNPEIIYVSGTLQGTGDEGIYVTSNKTIIGKPGAKIIGAQFFIFTVNNIIIQNITFKDYVNDAAVMIKYQATHVWVDHCDFSNDRNHGWAYWGKDISITRVSDYVTVSWCRFHDTNLSVLISGGITGQQADIGHLHVTMHHNFWYNVSEREPDMNYGSVHLFNNYHLNNSGYSVGARAGGNVRTDNEYFSGCLKPLSTNLAGDPPGYFSGVNTNIYSNCGSNDITTPIANWVPAYSYSSVLDPAADVPSIVQKSSGAILN